MKFPRSIFAVAALTFATPVFGDTWLGTTDSSWSTDANWLDGSKPTSSDNVVFDANATGSLTQTLGGAFSITGLTVGAVPGTAGSLTVSVANGTGGSLTIGSGGIDMSAATQNLSFSNAVTIGASQTWNVAASRTLGFNSGGNLVTFDLGGNTITKSGAGVLALTGFNIANGVLELFAGANTAAGSSGSNNGIASTGTVKIDTGASLTTTGSSGTFTLSGTMAMNGGTWNISTVGGGSQHILNGTITVSSAGGTIAQTTNIANPATVASLIKGNGILTLGSTSAGLLASGVIQDDTANTGALSLNITGIASITGTSNTYSGGTTIGGSGVLALAANGGTGTGTISMSASGATIRSTGTQAVTISNNLVTAGMASSMTLGNATNTGALTFTGTVSLGGYVKTFNVLSAVEFQGKLTGGSAGGISKTGAGALTISSSNTLVGAVAVSAGTLLLNGVNVYAGGTSVTGTGALVVGNVSALGSGAVTVASTAVLNVGAAGVILGSNASLTLPGKLVVNSLSNVVTLAGTGTYNLTGGTLDLNNLVSSAGSYTLITGGSGAYTDGLASIINYDASSYSVAFSQGILTVSAIPEPSTYGLLGAGALAAVAFVRRRKKVR